MSNLKDAIDQAIIGLRIGAQLCDEAGVESPFDAFQEPSIPREWAIEDIGNGYFGSWDLAEKLRKIADRLEKAEPR